MLTAYRHVGSIVVMLTLTCLITTTPHTQTIAQAQWTENAHGYVSFEEPSINFNEAHGFAYDALVFDDPIGENGEGSTSLVAVETLLTAEDVLSGPSVVATTTPNTLCTPDVSSGEGCICQDYIYELTVLYTGVTGIEGGAYDYHDNEYGYWESFVNGEEYTFNVSNSNHPGQWHEHNDPMMWTYEGGWIHHGTIDSSCGTDVIGQSFGPYTVVAYTDVDGNQCSASSGCNGAIDLTVTSGVAPFSFEWSTGATTEDVTELCAGEYTVTIYGANGSASVYTFVVEDDQEEVTAMASSQANTACGDDCTALCFVSSTGNDDVSAQMTIDVEEGPNTITLRTIYAKTFCDNTYGDNTIGWGSTSHTFDKLRGSDKLELALYDANGSLALQFELDYIDDGGQGVSGYGTGGVTDGDGDMITGNVAHILEVKTSLSENFNTYGYVLLDDSPATDDNYTVNPSYPNWIYEIWYEVTIDLAAFGSAGWGYPEITDFHASPSKTGNNSEPVEFSECCGTNCNGTIDLTVTSGVAPYTFLWSNGATTEDLTGVCAGEYTVVITDAHGCTGEATFTVEDDIDSPSAVATTTPNTLCTPDVSSGEGCICQDYIYELTVLYTGVTGIEGGAYDYHDNEYGYWESFVNGEEYTFNVSNSNHPGQWHEHNDPMMWTYEGGWIHHGTIDSSCGTDVIGQSFGPFTVVAYTDVDGNQCSASSGCNGAIDLTVTSGVAPFSFAWSNGATTEDISDLCSGDYTVTVYDDNGCSSVYTFEVEDDQGNIAAEVLSVTPDSVCSDEQECDVLCFESTTGDDAVSAQMEIDVIENENSITLRTIYAKTFCDNTYGDNTIGWGSTSHTFDKLRGSDKLELALYDANGSLALQFELDYIDDGGQGVSGYGTGGVTDGDGDMITGNVAHILEVKTSLSENFNTYGYVLLDDSPATDDNYTVNPSYPNWIYEIWYEVTIDLAAFGSAGWGYPEITDFHASPSKTGNNSEPVEFAGCCGAVSDECTGAIDISVTEGQSPYTFQWSNGSTTEDLTNACAGVHTVVITDANGCSTTLEVEVDCQSCTVACPSDLSLECDDSTDPDHTGYPSLSCASTIDWDYVDHTAGSCPTVLTRTFTGTYGVELYTCTQTLTIEDNDAPVLMGVPADAEYACGQVPAPADVTAQDNCGEVEVTFNETSAEVDNCDDVIVRTWTATDACGNTASASQTILKVADTPQVTVASTNENCGQADGSITFSFEDSNCRTGIEFSIDGGSSFPYNTGDNTGSLTVNGLGAGSYDVAVRWGNDDCQTDLGTVVIEDEEITLEIINQGVCVVDLYEWLSSGDVFEVELQPGDTYTVTTTIGDAWRIVGDDWDLAGFDESYYITECIDQVWNVHPDYCIPDCVLEVDAGSDVTVCEGEEVTFVATITGAIDCDEIVWSNGETTETITVTEAGTYTVTVTDCAGCEAIDEVTLYVLDLPEVTVDSADPNCDDNNGSITFTFADNPNRTNIEFSLDGGANWPAEYNTADNVGSFTINGLSGGTYELSVRWGNDECEVYLPDVTLEPGCESAPEVTSGVPSEVTVECDEVLPTAEPQFSDACDGSVAVTFEETSTGDDCTTTIVRTWTATNECGAATVVTQTIYVVDTTAPTFTYVPARIEGECGDVLGDDMATAEDNCNAVTITVEDFEYEYNGNSCGQFRTQTPGGWGAPASGSNPGSYRDANFDGAFPAGLTIGCDNTLSLTSAAAVEAFLPAGGSPSALPAGDLVDPTDYNNTFASHLVALKLSLGFDAYDSNFSDAFGPLGGLVVNNGAFEGMTVAEIVAIADEVIGGCSTAYSADALTGALTLINENYVDGAVDGGNLDCTTDEVCGYYVTRVFTATDACGNQAVATQCFSVIDQEAPVLVDVPADFEGDCNETYTAEAVTATDNCDDDVTIEVTSSTTGDACDYVITFTCTATDDCGNMSTASYSVSVSDGDAPVLSNLPADMTVECDAVPTAEVLTATDNCDMDVAVVFEESATSGCPYTITRTWTATDDCGNMTSHTQVVTVEDTVSPVAEFDAPDMTIECGDDEPVVDAIFSDNCDDDLELSAVSGIAQLDCGYEIQRSWTATDDCGNSTTVSQVISVVDTTIPVLSGVPADQTVSCDMAIAPADVTVTDNCDGDVEVVLTTTIEDADCPELDVTVYTWTATDACGNNATATQRITRIDDAMPTLEGVPADVTVECDAIPAPAEVTGFDFCSEIVSVELAEVIGDGCPYTITRTWTVTDACGQMASASQVITVEDTVSPVAEFDAPDMTIECGDDEPVVDAVFSDNCDDDLELSAVSGIAQLDCGYEIQRSWTATDDCGNSTTVSQVITVVDTTIPVLSGVPADQTVSCDMAIAPADVTATDNCDGDVEVVLTTTIEDANCPELDVTVYTWTATDACGNTATATQRITRIDDAMPTLEGVPADVTLECDAAIPAPAEVTGFDFCSEIVSVELAEVIGDGCPYIITRTWTVTDACGQMASASQVITVVDTELPVLSGVPADTTAECDMVPEPAVVTATDNCAADLEVVFTETVIEGDCFPTYTLLRCWTATDACGNTAEACQTIEVSDTTPPVVVSGDVIVQVSCDEADMMIPFVITDNCDDACEIYETITFENYELSGGCAGYIIRHYLVVDDCGNSTEFEQILQLYDDQAPVFTSFPEDMIVDCGAPIAPVTPEVMDNCDDDVNLSMTETLVPGDCLQEYSVIYTWTAIDHCDNIAVMSQTITVVDDQAPVAEFIAEDVTIECGDAEPLVVPVFTDNCDTEVEITAISGIVPMDCGYLIERAWTGTDDCGNSTTVSQVITVVDTTAPVLVGVPENVTVPCDMIPDAPEVYAVDSCNEGTELTVALEETADGSGCGYTITRTWTADDGCGNVSVLTQTIVVSECILGCTDETACNYSPEATCDDFSCDFSSCLTAGCYADFNQDGSRDASDLLILIGAWDCVGDIEQCPCDLNGDQQVNTDDMLELLGVYGTNCE